MHAATQRGLRDQDPHARIGDHVAQALRRQVGVERQVRAAGGEHGELGDDQVRVALDAHADAVLGAKAERAQVMREPRRARDQLGVGQRAAAGLDRDRIRRARRPRGDERRQHMLGPRPRAAVRHVDQLVLLVDGQQREPGERGLGIGDGRGQQRAEVAREPAIVAASNRSTL